MILLRLQKLVRAVPLYSGAEDALLRGLENPPSHNGESISDEAIESIAVRLSLGLEEFREEMRMLLDGGDPEPDVLPEAGRDVEEPTIDPLEKPLEFSEESIENEEGFLDFLDLPERQRSNLEDYIQRAAESNEISSEQVIVKMLAYAYDHLQPGKGGAFLDFSSTIGNSVDDELEILGQPKA